MKKKIALSFIMVLIMIQMVFAQDCPFGLINDTYPGDCGRYVDTNKDGICDLSQDIQPIINQQNIQKDIFPEKYPFILVLIISSIIYFTTMILSKKDKISILAHRKIWNFLLLTSFVWCAITSILFIFNLNYGLLVGSLQNLTFWHIETGIVLITISIFHILWHLSYYKNIFKS